MDAVERLISYLKIDTESVPDRDVIPSSEKQFDLAKVLEKELRDMGVSDVRLDEHCYVYGKLPSNLSGEEKAKTPALGLIAHMDTSPSARGKNVNPRIVKNYDGTDIVLNEGEKLSPKIFPRLLEQVGDDLLVTDGKTLLGADDKAGVAEIMALVEHLQNHKEIPHGDICIGKLKIHGVNVHPGSAKDKMLNSLLLAMEFNSMLPQFTPANTEGYEGFFHLCDMAGDESLTEMNYIIRDHDREKFEEKKRIFLDVAEKLNQKYNARGAFFEPEVKDSYFNMAYKVKEHMYLIDVAKTAFEKEGITPIVSPIRGGTDGASLSYKGLPCPNLSTGGDNFHGIYEYLNLNAFHKMIAVLLQITQEMIGKKA